jgi:hypothetical protein
MKVTIVFKNSTKNVHTGQDFDVARWEVHNTYNFLELVNADGSIQQFNLDDVFSFTAGGPQATERR